MQKEIEQAEKEADITIVKNFSKLLWEPLKTPIEHLERQIYL